ncbi:hypothetical protein [Novosphingobium sp. MMS21-SN21R]|uniref:hypothetical protein n=1 Tax=Novosphingobium sp. MMS21-SN21R TaxID=2969298 RepID=UPI002883DA29|nr:hypothetical protein [Novosphingobium sp. MMS21-SN21R]MDT0508196.1 hypothetical protein [Novosphingobium sp. MMS21-SN21R]
MFAVARAIVRRPIPVLCIAGIIGFLAMPSSEKSKPADPWSAAPVTSPEPTSQDSIIAKAASKAADLAAEADSTGTVAKVRGTVETSASSWETTSEAVASAAKK